MLTEWIDSNGYPYVQICKNRVRRSYKIHILLAILYIDNPYNKPNVNHKNGIKKDYTISNLEWCTQSENMKHAVATGLLTNSSKKGENHNTSKHSFEKVCNIRLLYNQGGISMRALAKQFNTTSGYISDVVNNKIRQTC